jgi:hypothetical protein
MRTAPCRRSSPCLSMDAPRRPARPYVASTSLRALWTSSLNPSLGGQIRFGEAERGGGSGRGGGATRRAAHSSQPLSEAQARGQRRACEIDLRGCSTCASSLCGAVRGNGRWPAADVDGLLVAIGRVARIRRRAGDLVSSRSTRMRRDKNVTLKGNRAGNLYCFLIWPRFSPHWPFGFARRGDCACFPSGVSTNRASRLRSAIFFLVRLCPCQPTFRTSLGCSPPF